MNKTTEALKLAEEALESCNSGKWSMSFDEIDVERALAAIREALADHPMDYDQGFVDGVEAQLAEPVKQDPVAWVNTRYNMAFVPPEGFNVYECDAYKAGELKPAFFSEEMQPVKQEPVAKVTDVFPTRVEWLREVAVNSLLYAAPVSAKREWVDLTDGEIEEVCISLWSGGWRQKAMNDFARAVITAFKEKRNDY